MMQQWWIKFPLGAVSRIRLGHTLSWLPWPLHGTMEHSWWETEAGDSPSSSCAFSVTCPPIGQVKYNIIKYTQGMWEGQKMTGESSVQSWTAWIETSPSLAEGSHTDYEDISDFEKGLCWWQPVKEDTSVYWFPGIAITKFHKLLQTTKN